MASTGVISPPSRAAEERAEPGSPTGYNQLWDLVPRNSFLNSLSPVFKPLLLGCVCGCKQSPEMVTSE